MTTKIIRPGNLAKGDYWGKCDECACIMVKRWDDDKPGPDLCGQECYDDYLDRPYAPSWATDY